jgi:HlyD family secretion protein
VPNAALRFSPERAAGDGERGGVTSVLVPRRGFRRGNRAEREVSIGRGSRQTVYVLGADGEPQPVRIVVGETNGSQTEVVGGDLSEGMEVITARLAPGQAQQKEERRGARNRQDGGGRGERAVPGNAASPEPAAPAREPAQPRTEAAQPEAKASAPAETPPPAGERPRLRDMTPEQRRAYRESLTPEQRAQMRERRQRRKAQPADAPDAE